jgi:hypothetical protein
MTELINDDFEITEEAFRIAEEHGIARKNVRQRYWDYGWEIERAITESVYKVDATLSKKWSAVCQANGVSNPLFYARVHKQGMTPEEAATKPVGDRSKKPIGLWRQYKEQAESMNIKEATFYARVRKGMPPEEAATKPIQPKGTYKKNVKGSGKHASIPNN